MPDYTDKTYLPVGTNLRYRRGDGALVTIAVTKGNESLPPPVEVTKPEPDYVVPFNVRKPTSQFFNLFAQAPRLATPETPAIQAAPATPAIQAAPPALVAAPAGRGPAHAAKPVAVAPASKMPSGPVDTHIFDHPIIGGKYTVFVLMYGPEKFYELHKRCLTALIRTMPAAAMDLRIGSNELNGQSRSFVDGLVRQGIVTKHYCNPTNEWKYPVMRTMFNDPEHPISTKWLLWFDDDTICDRNPMWATELTKHIIEHAPKNCHMFGDKFIWQLKPGQPETYKSRPWYRGRPFRTKNGVAAPNGDKVLFIAGGFWALSIEAMRAANIPDPALAHNGGDVTIGEQLWQAGFEMKQWNKGKQFVNTSSVPRRGASQPHFGTKDWTPIAAS